MRHAWQRKPWAGILCVLVVCVLLCLLVGFLFVRSKVRDGPHDIQQKAQFNAINAAVELFSNEFDGYPPSTAVDSMNQPYCGAMKLCEALMGQDLLGFHTNSVFRRDGLDAAGRLPLYPPNIDAMTAALRENNLKARKGPFLQAENANAFQMQDIYGTNIGPFLGTTFVLCDVYSRQMQSGKKTGMPVLYYRADTANSYHDPNFAQGMTPADSKGNIYNYWDNHEIVKLGKAWQAGGTSSGVSNAHKMLDPIRFYRNTRIDQITTTQGRSARIRSSCFPPVGTVSTARLMTSATST